MKTKLIDNFKCPKIDKSTTLKKCMRLCEKPCTEMLKLKVGLRKMKNEN